MKIGLIGRKRGMTRVFTEEGNSVPVTVIEVSPNRVTQVKNEDTDGYRSIQVTIGQRRAIAVKNDRQAPTISVRIWRGDSPRRSKTGSLMHDEKARTAATRS